MIDLYNEVKKIWRPCSGIRRNNGNIEFALETCHRELCWFPIAQAPINVEKYINCWLKINPVTEIL